MVTKNNVMNGDTCSVYSPEESELMHVSHGDLPKFLSLDLSDPILSTGGICNNWISSFFSLFFSLFLKNQLTFFRKQSFVKPSLSFVQDITIVNTVNSQRICDNNH